MTEPKFDSLAAAQQHFARSLNGRTWDLLDKTDRTPAEAEQMLHAAHASCYHWLQVGTGLNHQRGEWLVARVYTILGHAEPALRHARRCLALTEEFSSLMQDFDWAYAYEAMARASALAGDREEALRYLQQAEQQGESIADDEDKRIFQSDVKGGNWYGVR